MKNMEELKDMLCEELEEITKKGEISMGDLDVVEKITTSIKNIDKIVMADRYSYGESEGSYGSYRGSYDGGMHDMSNRGSYGNEGSSYARGRHYVRGHYSYGDDVSTKLEEMLNDSRMDSNDKRILRQAMEIIRK